MNNVNTTSNEITVPVDLSVQDLNTAVACMHSESQRIGLSDGGKSQLMIIQTLSKFQAALQTLKTAQEKKEPTKKTTTKSKAKAKPKRVRSKVSPAKTE